MNYFTGFYDAILFLFYLDQKNFLLYSGLYIVQKYLFISYIVFVRMNMYKVKTIHPLNQIPRLLPQNHKKPLKRYFPKQKSLKIKNVFLQICFFSKFKFLKKKKTKEAPSVFGARLKFPELWNFHFASFLLNWLATLFFIGCQLLS
jgi:hypothetical protein